MLQEPVQIANVPSGRLPKEDVSRIGKLFRELSLNEVCLRPYVQPLFDRLYSSGIKLAIVSNTEAVLTRFEPDRRTSSRFA